MKFLIIRTRLTHEHMINIWLSANADIKMVKYWPINQPGQYIGLSLIWSNCLFSLSHTLFSYCLAYLPLDALKVGMSLYACGLTHTYTVVRLINWWLLVHLPQPSCFLLRSLVVFVCFGCSSECVRLVSCVLRLMSAVTVSLYERAGPFRQSGDKEGVIVDKKAVFELKWGRILSEGLLAFTLEMCWGSCCLESQSARAKREWFCQLAARFVLTKSFYDKRHKFFSCLREALAGGNVCLCWRNGGKARQKERGRTWKLVFLRKPTSCTSDGINARDVFLKEKTYGMLSGLFVVI